MSTYRKSGLGVEPPEATQFIQAQAGCSESLSQLMARHDGLVQAVVRQQVLGELPFEEALQAGRIGLWRAILGFDPERGFAFSTYAWPSIRHHIWRAIKVYGRGEEVGMRDEVIRQELLELLRGGRAHMDFDQAVADFPPQTMSEMAPKAPYTPWQLLEHMRIAQRDILAFIQDPDYVSPDWPEG